MIHLLESKNQKQCISKFYDKSFNVSPEQALVPGKNFLGFLTTFYTFLSIENSIEAVHVFFPAALIIAVELI